MEVSPGLQSRLDQLAKLSRGARMGILAVAAVLIGAAYYFGYYQAQHESLMTMRAQELELQRKLSEVRSIAANIGAFEAEITQLEAQLSVALRQLPNEKQLEVLLADISNLGKTAGIEIKSFKRESEVMHDFYAEVPISVQLEGTYHDIAKFFDSVSRLPRIVNMGALDLKVASANTTETRLTVSGTATTFRFVNKS
jgi:type IV pilus assembly protein PilO